jgi:peptidase E
MNCSNCGKDYQGLGCTRSYDCAYQTTSIKQIDEEEDIETTIYKFNKRDYGY